MNKWSERQKKQFLKSFSRLEQLAKEFDEQTPEDKPNDPKCHPEQHPLANVYGKILCDKCGNYYEKEPEKLAIKLRDFYVEGMVPFAKTQGAFIWDGVADTAIDEVLKIVREIKIHRSMHSSAYVLFDELEQRIEEMR